MKSITSIFGQLIQGIRKTLWALIVAYMLGIHNFYYGDTKTQDNSIVTVEVKGDQTNSTSKD